MSLTAPIYSIFLVTTLFPVLGMYAGFKATTSIPDFDMCLIFPSGLSFFMQYIRFSQEYIYFSLNSFIKLVVGVWSVGLGVPSQKYLVNHVQLRTC